MMRLAGSVLASFFVLAFAGGAAAQNTCNGQLAIEYVTVQNPNVVGSIDRVRLVMGAGSIGGGNRLDVSRIAFNLDCRNNRYCSNAPATSCTDNAGCPGGTCVSVLPGCIDDGAVAGYVGNITTTCPGVTWTANSLGGAVPNEVRFTASTPVAIPAGTFPYCALEFDFVKLSETSNDSTPKTIEQVAAFDVANCNNGLAASSRISGAVGISGTPDVTPGTVPAPTLSAAGALLLAAGLAALGGRRLRRRRLS